MPRVYKAISIKVPEGRATTYVEDPRNAAEWIERMLDVKDIREFHCNWTWEMAGVRFDGESDPAEEIPNEKMVIRSEGNIECTWTSDFRLHGDTAHRNIARELVFIISVLILLRKSTA